MHNNVNQRLQRTASEQAAATSLRLTAAGKQSTESSKTPSMNRPATTQYLNIISYEQDEVGDVLARSMSKLKQSLSQAATTTAQQDSGMLDDSANKVDSQAEKMAVYSKLAGKIINRDQALQERVAQNLSTSKRLVRSRDAATSLQQAMDKLPAQLKEGTNAGRDLAKFMVENLVSLTDTKNMGAGLERDLAVRQVVVPKHQPNLRVQQASQKVLAASIAYIQSNQPEVLSTLKDAPATSDNAAANTKTTAQAMTQYLHQALNEFPNDSTYLDIFKQNRSQQTSEGYADKMSEEIAQRIHDLIAKAANTAKSGNLIKLSPEEAATFDRIVRDAQQHAQNNGLRSMERIFSQATTSTGAPVQNSTGAPNANAQANAAGTGTVTPEQGTISNQVQLSPAEEDALTEQALKVADRNTKNEHVRNLSLSDLSSRAARLQEEFRAERQRMVQEGKLPNPATPPQDNFADDEALFTKAQSSNRAQTGAQVEANSRVLNEALIKARSALESRISTPLSTEAKSASTQQAQAANTQQAPASTSTTTSNATNAGTTSTTSSTTTQGPAQGQTLNQTAPAQSNAATAQQPAANATTQGAANATTASTSTPAQATAPQANANASNTINQTAQSAQQAQAQAQAQAQRTTTPAPAPAPEAQAQGKAAANQFTAAPAPNTSAQKNTAPTPQHSAPQSAAPASQPQPSAAEDRVTTLNFDQNTLRNTSLNLSYTAVQSSIYGDMDIMPGMTIPVSHFGDYTDGNMQPNKAAIDALQQQAHKIYNQVRNDAAPAPAPAPVVSDADEAVQQQPAQQNQQATQQAQRPATATTVPADDGVIEAKPQAPVQQQQPAQQTQQQAQRPATANPVPTDDGVIEAKPQAPVQQQQPAQQTQQQTPAPAQSTTSQVVADGDEAVQQQQQAQQNQQATQQAQRPATATPVPTDDGVIEAKPQAPVQQQQPAPQQMQQQTPAQGTTTSQVVADGDAAVQQQQQTQQSQQATQQAQRPATSAPVPTDDGVIEAKPQAPVQQQQPAQQTQQQTQAPAQSTTSQVVADGDEAVQQQAQPSQQAAQQAQRPATATPVPTDDGVIEAKPQAPVQQQPAQQTQQQTPAPAQSTTSQVVADGDEAVQQQQQAQQNQQATQQVQRPANATPVPADDGVIEAKPQAPVQQQQPAQQTQQQTPAPAQNAISQVVADGDDAVQQQQAQQNQQTAPQPQHPAVQSQQQAPAQPQLVAPTTPAAAPVAPETHTDPNAQTIGQTQHVLNGNFKSNMYARLYGNLQQENYAAAQIKQPTHRAPAPAEVEPQPNVRPQPAPAPQANTAQTEATAPQSPASPAQSSPLEGSQSISTSYQAQTTHATEAAAAAVKENASLESLQQANTIKAQLEINLDLPNEALTQAPVSENNQGRVATQQTTPAPSPAPQPAAEDDSAFARLYQQAQQAGETARAERDAAQRTQANLAQEHAQQQVQTQRQQQQQAVIQQQQQTVANDKYHSAQQQVQQQIVADEQAAGGNTIGNTAIRATGTTLASAHNAILEQASQPQNAPNAEPAARQGQVGTTQVEARTAAAGASQTVLADNRTAATQQQQQPVQQQQTAQQAPAPQQPAQQPAAAPQQQAPATQPQPAPAPQQAPQAAQSQQPAPVQPQPAPVQSQPNPASQPQPQPAPAPQAQNTAPQPSPAPAPQQAQANVQSTATPAPAPTPAPATPAAPSAPAAPNTAPVATNGAPVANTVPNSNAATVTTDKNVSGGISSLQGISNVTNLAAVGNATAAGTTPNAQASGIGSGAVNLNTNLSEDSLQDEIIKNVMQTVPSDELDADALQNNSLGQALSGVVADTDLTENQDSFDAILRKNQAAPQTVAMAATASVLPTNSTPGAAQITAGQNAPIPDETVINNTSAPRESSGLLRRLASFFGHHSDTVEDNAPPATATSAKSSMDPSFIALESAAQLQQKVQAQAPQQFSAFDHLMGRLQGAAIDPELPPAMKEQAQKFLQALQDPVADLHTVSNWLNFVTGPLSPSSSQALALHQWAFMLLCIRFEQLGKNIERFLKKSGGNNAVKELGGEVKRTQSLFEAIDDKTVHKSNDLLKETFNQVERLQQQMQNLPMGQVLPRNVPLPPFYQGGQEGSMTAQRQQEEDGGSSWHLNFNFDLENLGPLQIKVRLRFPEVQISFVAERLETLQKVQENMPILNARLREIGLNSKGSSARLGRISLPEVKHDTASSEDNFKFEGPSFTTRA